MLISEMIREIAEREVGVSEVDGPNDGPRIREYQDAVRPCPLPLGHPDYAWCAAFCVWVYREAGIDGQWITASTALACTNAERAGFVSTVPRSGALLCTCGTHVGILIEPVAPGLWRTLEGNSGDAVRWRTRSLTDNSPRILVPAEVGSEAEPVDARRRYWIQDPAKGATPEWLGPWLAKGARDALLKRLEEKLGRRLRPCSFFGAFDPETGKMVVKPDPMGPTKGGDDDLDAPPSIGGADDLPGEATDVPAGLAGGG